MIEDLADSLYADYPSAALALYIRANNHEKVCKVLIAKGYIKKLISYCSKNGFNQKSYYVVLWTKITRKVFYLRWNW